MSQTLKSFKAAYLRSSLLWLGGCWLSSFGMLATPAFAQTSSDAAIPSAQDLLLPAQPAAPEAPSTNTFEAAPQPAPEPPAAESAPTPSKSVDLELSTPGTASSPHQTTESNPAPLVAPDLAEQAKSMFDQPGSSSNFIDSTPYSVGATDNPNVVLSERSTGCETTIQPGSSVPNSVCSYPSYPVAGGNHAGGLGVMSSGDGSLSVVYGGRTTPVGRDYYNLTIRPPAHLTSGNLNFLFPLSIPAAITSAFGWRIHPLLGQGRFHSGTDLGAPQGTPVLAAFSGKVAMADFMGGYGLAVLLQHENDTEESLYGHLSEIFVKPGETVKQGEVIGRVGSTGLSTGPHLHFEFRKQTPNGWAVMDAGGALEYALSQFVNALKLGLPYPQQVATIRSASFTKALEMAEAKVYSNSEQQPLAQQKQISTQQEQIPTQ